MRVYYKNRWTGEFRMPEMIDVLELNIPSASVGDFIKETVEYCMAVIKTGAPLCTVQPRFLWGPAGVGKSAALRQIRQELSQKTGKTVILRDIRVMLRQLTDFMGVPFPDRERHVSEWLPPEEFMFDGSPDVINLLFLDELSSAPKQVQAAAYQIVYDRAIGTVTFPDNLLIIGAGNRLNDKGVSYEMPLPLANRFKHYNITADIVSWQEWAKKTQVHPLVIGYLSDHPEKLLRSTRDLKKGELAYPSPRTWEFVSRDMDLLYGGGGEFSNSLHNNICSAIGLPEGMEFEAWCRTNGEIPVVSEILDGKCRTLPKKQDVAWSVIRTLLAFLDKEAARISSGERNSGEPRIFGNNGSHPEEEDERLTFCERLENICRYVSRLPVDFASSFYREALEKEEIRLSLMSCPSFKSWMRLNRRAFEKAQG